MSTEHLLSKEVAEDHMDEVPLPDLPPAKRRRTWQWHVSGALIAHLTVLALYTFILALTINHLKEKYKSGPDLVFCKLSAISAWQ